MILVATRERAAVVILQGLCRTLIAKNVATCRRNRIQQRASSRIISFFESLRCKKILRNLRCESIIVQENSTVDIHIVTIQRYARGALV